MADITITEGDTLEVDYSLENTGDGTGTFDPRLLVQGVQEDQDTGITLDPAQTATGTLQWPTEDGDAVTDAPAEVLTDDTRDTITVTVDQIAPNIEDWDSYTTGTVAPGSWTNINGGGEVSDVRAFSTPNSYLVSDNLGGAGAKYIEWATTPAQYTFNWDFRIYENDAASSRAAVRFDNENGDSILYLGTNSPNILLEGASTVEVDSGSPGSWQGLRVSFDWASGEATASYRSADFSTVLGTETVSLKSVSPLNIGGVSFSHGGESATWGGGGNEVYWDDCTITNE